MSEVGISKFDAHAFLGMIEATIERINGNPIPFMQLINEANKESLLNMKKDLQKAIEESEE